jgi:hypothetical protein
LAYLLLTLVTLAHYLLKYLALLAVFFPACQAQNKKIKMKKSKKGIVIKKKKV